MNSTPASEPGVLGLGQQRAVHVGVAARLEHQRRSQVVVVLAQPLALLEHRRSLNGGKSVRRSAAAAHPPCGHRWSRIDAIAEARDIARMTRIC